MICYHTIVNQFSGDIELIPGPQARLNVKGTCFVPGDDALIQLTVQLPQHRLIPWWLYVYGHLAESPIQGHNPSVRLTSLRCFDFDTWQLHLPWLGSFNLHDFCGYLPIHVVLTKHSVEIVHIVVQRRRHCTHLVHDDVNTIVCTQDVTTTDGVPFCVEM